MILHTLNALPTSQAFADCLRAVAPGDALLLLGDGVYAALPGTGAWTTLGASGVALYVLLTDAEAAGVVPASPIETVDMDGFVALSEQYPRQQAWY